MKVKVMRKYLALILLVSFLVSANTSESYKVEGMSCGFGCVNKVKSVMNAIDGVNKCDVDFEKSLMIVEFDDSKVNSEIIIKSLSEETTYKTSMS